MKSSAGLEEAVAALRERPVSVTDKGFGVLAADGPVTAAGLAAQRKSLSSLGFTMPLLVLRETALHHNITAMAAYCASAGVRLAPHGKTTMAPQLFARQLAAGAWAMSAATIGHVQVYRAFGVGRVLLANELTDEAGTIWLTHELAADPGFECYVYVDSEAGVRWLGRTLRAAGTVRPLPVLVELGFEGGRTGSRDIDTAVAVARGVDDWSDVLVLAGAAGYEGGLGGDRSPASVTAVTRFCRDLRTLGERLAAGSRTPGELVLSAGGSAYYDVVAQELTAGWEGAVVLRSGTYVTFDHGMYARVAPAPGAGAQLRPALELWAQVLSRPEPGLALLCAGRRDVAFDAGLPVPLRVRYDDGRLVDVAGWQVVQLNDQHAFLTLPVAAELGPGDLVCMGISHPCTTFDKWRVIPVVDDDSVVVDVVHTFF
ncbi:MAG TPA: hypothetical protein VGS19_31930 [Streptosporangiaceae bacterium]|nr:hypothetical protein [Streptosporangiaceae bacterium]